MRDRVRPRSPEWRGALLLLALLPVRAAAAPVATLAEVTGTYNHTESYSLVQQSDGTFRRTRQSSSYWGQNYRASLSTQLRNRTLLYTELRYADISYTDGSRRSTTPTGLLRLTAPAYGLTASYRPARRTAQVSGPGAAGDTTAATETSEQLSRSYDLNLSGYVAPGRLPRLEGQWVQRHQFATASALAATGVQRSLQAVQDFRSLTLRAGYADQGNNSVGRMNILRRTYTAGAAYATTFAGANPVRLDYGFQRGETPGRAGDVRNYTHSVNGAASYRASQRSTFDGGGFYNSALMRDGTRHTVTNYDLYAYHRYAYSAATSSRVGAGQRTVQGREGTQASPYLLASVSTDGTPRPRWRARASASHATNWLRDEAPASSEAVNLGSTFDFSRTFNLRVDLQSTVRPGRLEGTTGRCASTAAAGVMIVPLRSTTIQLDASFQGFGSGPLSLASRSSTESASLQWRPTSRMSVLAQHTISGTLPDDRPRLHGTTLTTSWRPTPRVQFDGNYARWDGTPNVTTGERGNSESLGLRMASRLTRRLSAGVGFQHANRGRPSETRMFDATASYRFDL